MQFIQEMKKGHNQQLIELSEDIEQTVLNQERNKDPFWSPKCTNRIMPTSRSPHLVKLLAVPYWPLIHQ